MLTRRAFALPSLATLLAASCLVAAPGGATSAAAEAGASAQEIEALRSPYSNTYEQADGSHRAEVFTEPVNYRRPDGSFTPIDNTLVPSDRPGYAYENAANSYKALFPADLAREPIRIEAAGESISFQLEGANGAPAEPGSVADEAVAAYPNALAGVEVSYRVGAEGVEELIELPSPEAAQEFSFRTKLSEGLGLADDGRGLSVTDEAGGEVFALAPPLAYDAAGEVEPLELELDRSVPGAEAEVSITPDPEWIDDPEREYPVIVDPTVLTKTGNPAKDCRIKAGLEDPRCTGNLWVGYDGSRHRSLLKFPIEEAISLDADALLSATLQMHVAANSGPAIEASIHRLTQKWTTAVTWKKRTAIAEWSSYGGTFIATADYTNAATGDTVGAWESWDAMPMVKAWLNDKPNRGLIAKSPASGTSVVRFSSAEAQEKPKLTVVYRSDLGLELPPPTTSYSAELKWGTLTPPPADTTAFEIHRREVFPESDPELAPTTWRLIDRVPAATRTYADYLLWGGATYHYEVRALTQGSTVGERRQVTIPTVQAGAAGLPRLYSDLSFWNQKITGPASGNPWHQLTDADLAQNSSAIVTKAFVNPKKADGSDAGAHNFTAQKDYGQSLVYADPSSSEYAVECQIPAPLVPGCFMTTHVAERDLVRIPRYATSAINQGDDAKLTVFDPLQSFEYGMNETAYDLNLDTGSPNTAWRSQGRARYELNGTGLPMHNNNGVPCPGEGHFCGGPTAAGFSNMAGAVRPEEIAAGEIKHALAISTTYTRRTLDVDGNEARYIACPATGRAMGSVLDVDAVPLGARVQLHPQAPISQNWPKTVQVIAQALKEYGAFVHDTGGSVAIQGENELGRGYNAWTDDDKLAPETGDTAKLLLNNPNIEPDFPWNMLRVVAFKQNSGNGCVNP